MELGHNLMPLDFSSGAVRESRSPSNDTEPSSPAGSSAFTIVTPNRQGNHFFVNFNFNLLITSVENAIKHSTPAQIKQNSI